MGTGDPAWNSARVAVLAVAPAVLGAALLAHPFISGRLPNETAIAEEVTANPTVWGAVHLGAAVGSALIAIAFLAVRSYLHQAGENRYSMLGMPLVVLGSMMFAVLPGMEFAPLAASDIGATASEVAAVQSAIVGWFMAVLLVGGIAFAAGASLFATAISRAGVASAGLTRVVVAALFVMAVTRFVPLAIAQFYLQALAGLFALWPLAYVMWTHPAPPRTAAGREGLADSMVSALQ